MILLVTGGAGFIGSNFVKHRLENTSDKIIVLDALTYAGVLDNLKSYLNDSNLLVPTSQYDLKKIEKTINQYGVTYNDVKDEVESKRLSSKLREFSPKYINIEDLNEKIEEVLENTRLAFVVGNIIDSTLDEKLMNLSDIVVHFAAESHVDRSIFNADAFVKTDVYGTYSLLEAAKKCEKLNKFIHISTDEVYGQAKEKPFKETDPLNPRNPYSASKAAADRMAYAYYQTYGVPVVIVRPSNNFGPNQYPEKLIPVVTIKALNNEPIPVYGDGKQRRDWLYVEDTAKAINLLIEKGEIGQAYNVAGRNERENMFVVERILEITGKSKDLIKHVKDRPGHDLRYLIDDTKIRGLGFKQDRTFEELFDHTVKWYLKNKNWWEKILREDEEYKEFMEKWYENR
ncbi:GDP-mannose 4,6-dehydratase [Mesoaciditoga lauensis]|uniref:GDP-mannose 4,6-dehydratase n=1 Tax=Mesoaciditoga lauensis TaxID=1495039 RepID=UPI00055DC236|nr:GDP-mannose 4,6-dehydratase [Mesoaciditoga lauensis]